MVYLTIGCCIPDMLLDLTDHVGVLSVFLHHELALGLFHLDVVLLSAHTPDMLIPGLGNPSGPRVVLSVQSDPGCVLLPVKPVHVLPLLAVVGLPGQPDV